MAKLVGAFTMSHSLFCYLPADRWGSFFNRKPPPRADVQRDSQEENRSKADRIKQGLAELRRKVLEVRPDVLIVFGDDQLECFDFNNFPAFAIYIGPQFSGYSLHNFISRSTQSGEITGPQQQVRGHPELALGLLTGLMERGFDPAYCMDMPKPNNGVGHAFMRPAESLGAFSLPVVPLFFNCFFAPQPKAMRCYQLGRAVREAIEEYPQDLRVAIVGSGGLWHTPATRESYLDTGFDRQMLERLQAGNARGMAEYFDGYRVPDGDSSQDTSEQGSFSSGLPGPGGPQKGTREICTWIAAASVFEGRPWTVVDYVPVYAAPIGVGLAYCTDV